MDSISDIDVNLLKIDNSQDGKFMNILCDDKPIVFATPSFPVPFGLEESYITQSKKNFFNSFKLITSTLLSSKLVS